LQDLVEPARVQQDWVPVLRLVRRAHDARPRELPGVEQRVKRFRPDARLIAEHEEDRLGRVGLRGHGAHAGLNGRDHPPARVPLVVREGDRELAQHAGDQVTPVPGDDDDLVACATRSRDNVLNERPTPQREQRLAPPHAPGLAAGEYHRGHARRASSSIARQSLHRSPPGSEHRRAVLIRRRDAHNRRSRDERG
jgi:hypothetical protein